MCGKWMEADTFVDSGVLFLFPTTSEDGCRLVSFKGRTLNPGWLEVGVEWSAECNNMIIHFWPNFYVDLVTKGNGARQSTGSTSSTTDCHRCHRTLFILIWWPIWIRESVSLFLPRKFEIQIGDYCLGRKDNRRWTVCTDTKWYIRTLLNWYYDKRKSFPYGHIITIISRNHEIDRKSCFGGSQVNYCQSIGKFSFIIFPYSHLDSHYLLVARCNST